jgi:Ca2+-binding RTX toxin-like protein
MAVEWNAYQGGDTSYQSILFNVLKFGAVTDAATDAVTVEYDGQSIVFEGDFILNGGNVQAGMVHNLSLYDGEDLVAEASGYWLDVGVIGDVADQLQFVASDGPIYGMLNLQPVTFNGSPDSDMFFGGIFDDTLYGKGGNDVFFGGGGNDLLVGGGGSDILMGSFGSDELRGGSGGDRLIGDVDNDLLVGGGGHDSFVFENVALGNGVGQAGVDTIADFTPGKDVIELDKAVFTAIGNHLGSGEFHLGGSAQDGNDHILYKANTGALFYDPDGDGAAAKIKFAVLDNKPELSSDDFMMIAA